MKGEDVLLMIPARVISIRARKLSDLDLARTKAIWADQRKPINKRLWLEASKRFDRAVAEAGKFLFGIEVPYERDAGFDWAALREVRAALVDAGIDYEAESLGWARARADERRRATNARRVKAKARARRKES